MFNNVYFGIILSALAYKLGLVLNRKLKSHLANPLLIAILVCVVFLKIFNIDYSYYNKGAQYITFLIAPATVGLIVSLYKNLHILKENLIPIIVGVIVGSIVAITSVIVFANIFGLNDVLSISLMPQSVTTAIAMPLVDELGGNASLGAVAVIIRGVVGAVIAPMVVKLLGVKNSVAIGIGIGTSSHAVGTSRAIEMGEVEGAMSGLSIAIAGIFTVFVVPILISII